MHRVLMISYLFPPMGGAGVQRTLKFVKYLPEFGWQAHVLTGQPPRNSLRDEALVKEIPANTPITRTYALIPSPKLPWRLRDVINRWLFTVDEQVGWLPFARRAGLQIIQENQVEVIYSTSAPYTDHLVALYLHRRTHIPWVADFRDPWIGNFNLRFPTPAHRKLVERLEREVIQGADRIIVVSPPMSKSFIGRIPELSPEKILWIPNGFDTQDFSEVQPLGRNRDCFYLVYTGSFYAQEITANPTLRAIKIALNSGQIPRQRFRVQLVGNIGKSTHKWISEMGLNDIIEAPGYVDHAQSIAYLLSADALLLVLGVSPNSKMIYTGKIFEYLGAGKPILCLARDGVAASLIRDTRAGIIVPPDDVSLIAQKLIEMYQNWQNGKLSIEPDRNLIKTFERRHLTEQLADVLNLVSGIAE